MAKTKRDDIMDLLTDIDNAEYGVSPAAMRRSERAERIFNSYKVDNHQEDEYDRGCFGIPVSEWKGMYNEFPLATTLVIFGSVMWLGLVIGIAVGAI